jgi:hypothetical protein
LKIKEKNPKRIKHKPSKRIIFINPPKGIGNKLPKALKSTSRIPISINKDDFKYLFITNANQGLIKE